MLVLFSLDLKNANLFTVNFAHNLRNLVLGDGTRFAWLHALCELWLEFVHEEPGVVMCMLEYDTNASIRGSFLLDMAENRVDLCDDCA